MAGKKDEKTNIVAVVLPAVITAIVGIVGAFLSYQAGLNEITIPLSATQTAEAKQPIIVNAEQKQIIDVPIAVDSNPGWHPTGFIAKDGDFVLIKVVAGKWTVYRKVFPQDVLNQISEESKKLLADEIYMNWYRETDGSGSSSRICEIDDNCPLLGQRVGGLVALIGKTKYFIGNNCAFKATDSGEIFLQINDNPSEPTGNFGVLAVTIASLESGTNAVSTGCGIPNP